MNLTTCTHGAHKIRSCKNKGVHTAKPFRLYRRGPWPRVQMRPLTACTDEAVTLATLARTIRVYLRPWPRTIRVYLRPQKARAQATPWPIVSGFVICLKGNHSYTPKGWMLRGPACEIPPKEISLISSSLSARKTPHGQSVVRHSPTSAFIYVLQLALSLACLQHSLVLRSPKKQNVLPVRLITIVFCVCFF